MVDKDLLDEVYSGKAEAQTVKSNDSPRLNKVKNMSLYDIAVMTPNKPEFFMPDLDD